nr:PREDICTED: tRNA (guanine-N(7)-)-methyltransferase non-catalytic subunit wdr4-like [Bemisia tabaci]XP_018906833.1 PREDICTED: tRNA (guanine-N(7)-)-methyltransferase non-catalytic subunit wdr4-like [Bemisia tabaci]XP_018906834.1 PREDICTED: tRNA (guanine-N(7)-)-methyltransferase non-catalytic subunit wdr4-like [Bemisia tabaci]XP_018906835.1 PREDICTED: tRNA (guanine-N(7)-)-methyltransferase non-catalytic subunit wdr4-like [Bemisia tabaci]XP_018906836.1 PREDICTED: tRNA (guanine-N(7)-)-methyltransf
MACISVSNNLIAVTSKYSSIFLRLSDQKFNLVEAGPNRPSRFSGYNRELDVASSAISPCGKWFAYSINNKRLSVWDIDNWQLVVSKKIPRGGSKICFTADSESVIVADKSGEVLSFNLDSSKEEGTFLLGHVSILLDMILTPDNFIVTCDRDEKIRVSHYPNSYNIQTYCLGHEEFVTSINLFSASAKIILSSSGDGTIRFWNYLTGAELSVYNCSDDVQPDTEKPIPVTKVQLTQFDSTLQIACVSLHKHNEVLVYHIANSLNVILSQRIPLLKPPLYILLTGEKDLWVLENQGVQVYSLDRGRKSFIASSSNKFKTALEILNKHIAAFSPSIEESDDISVLYKRTYDEVQDYLERKITRISEGSTNSDDDGSS